jgi:hypothetical protein
MIETRLTKVEGYRAREDLESAEDQRSFDVHLRHRVGLGGLGFGDRNLWHQIIS